MLIQVSVGMDIDAVKKRITFCRAVLPDSINRLQLVNLAIGDARLDVQLDRHAGDVGVSVLREGEVRS